MRRASKSSPPPPSLGPPLAFYPPQTPAVAREVGGGERTLAGFGPVGSGQPVLQIRLQTNNISLAKVIFDGEVQIKVRKTDFVVRETGGEFACRALTIETYTQLIVPVGGGGGDDSATQELAQLITPQMFRSPPPPIGGSHRIYVFWTHWSKRTILFHGESGTCLVCARPCGVRASTPNTPGLRYCDLVTKQGRWEWREGG